MERRFADLEDLNDLVSRSRRLPTEFIAEGGASWFGEAFWVELRTGGDFFYSFASRSTHHGMRRYEGMDWAWIGRRVVSLLCLVLVWAVVMVILPQTAYLTAVRAVELPADGKESLRRAVAEMEAGRREEGITLRPRAAAAVDGFARERRYLVRLTAGEREGVQRLQEAARRAVRQYEVARWVNLLSPGYAFQYALEGLLGAGLPKYQSFERQAWAYRETLREWVRAREAADPESPQLLFLPGYLSREPLDGQPVPRFQGALATGGGGRAGRPGATPAAGAGNGWGVVLRAVAGEPDGGG